MSKEQVYDIDLQNGGNTPIVFSVKAVDNTGRLRFEGERDSVSLEPEARETVQLRATIKDRPLVGAPYYLPFEVRISAGDAPPGIKIGQFEVRPLLPMWLFFLLPLLATCLLLMLLLYVWPPEPDPTITPTVNVGTTTITPGPTPAATQSATATTTAAVTGTATATATTATTLSPTASTTASPTAGITASPTASSTPSPTASVTPSLTPTPTATSTPTRAVTPTPTVTRVYGPLSFTVEIVWRIDPNDRRFAIASVTITATGGDGNYTYYRDDIRQVGPEFEYVWRSCSSNPISFRVTSGDGQSARKEFGEYAPCP
jgi:hypothetical protein